MGTLGSQVGLGNLGIETAVPANLHLMLSTDLGVVAGLESLGEALAELAVLEIGHGILASGNILGEEVVEVVRDERVVDTASVAKCGQDEKRGQETAEAARLGLLRFWARSDSSSACAEGRDS